MPDYTIKDTQTGKTITFKWSGSEPPTDADMEDVFAEAHASASTAEPEAMPVAESAHLSGPAAVGLGYASQLLPKALPAVNKAASYVAGSPTAQRAVGATIGGLIGAGTKTDIALDAFLGGSMKDLVGQGAAKLAKLTAGSRALVGRAANGQFTRLALQSIAKLSLGQALGALSSEGEALSRYNDPSELAKLKR